MIGIYKITSPIGRIYIGQSIDVERRFKSYYKLNCSQQIRLYRSLLKYGVYTHKFEIICICDKSELNKKERFYQDFYNSTNKNGLNCSLTQTDTDKYVHSETTINKLKYLAKKRPGIKERMEIVRKKRVNYKQSEETISKIRNKLKGRKQSDEHKNKITLSKIGKKRDPIKTEKRASKKRKILLNTQTGIFYFGVKEAALSLEIKQNTLYGALNANAKYKNNYPIIYA